MAIRGSETRLRPAAAELIQLYSEEVADLCHAVELIEEAHGEVMNALPSSVVVYGDESHGHCDALAALLDRAADRFGVHEAEYWELKRVAAELGAAIASLESEVEGAETDSLGRTEEALTAALARRPYPYPRRRQARRTRRSRCISI